MGVRLEKPMGKPAWLAHHPNSEANLKKRLISFLLAAVMIVAAIPGVSAASKRHFKILFIGNSYSEDATDGFTYPNGDVYEGYSTFYKMMKKALGGGVELEIALAMSGGKSMTWHATTAANEQENYEFRVVGDETDGLWKNVPDVRTTAGALSYDNWDAVVLQPYGPEIEKGSSASAGSTKPYATIEDSTSFMLDYVGERVPDAEVYLYLIISRTQENEYFAGLEKFNSIRYYTDIASHLTGEKTGKGFTAVVPVGTAIQNARSTYLTYHRSVDPSGVVSFDTDPVTGLQRDELHVSYSVGRYIAALTFTETLVLESERRGDPLTVGIRRPEDSEPLPDEYKQTAQAAVTAALESVSAEGGDKYASVDLTAYKNDPADAVADGLSSGTHEVYLPPEDDPAEVVKNALEAELPRAAVIETHAATLTREGDKGTVAVTLTYGYKTVEATVPITFIDHEHVWELVSGGYVHDVPEFTEEYKCSVCGKEKVSAYKQDPCPSRDFSDVPPYGDWAHPGIDYCIKKGLMNGVSATLFDPEGVMTRAMLVTVLWRYAGEPGSDASVPFKDLTEDWYRDAVLWAFEESVIMGTSGTTFSPDDPLTREQIATILFRYTGGFEKGPDGADLSGFPDHSKISDYAKDAMSWANAAGLINGVGTAGGTILDPLGNATRAQVAAILCRYVEVFSRIL